MKAYYSKPESKVEEFTTTDVITTSGNTPGHIDPVGGEDD